MKIQFILKNSRAFEIKLGFSVLTKKKKKNPKLSIVNKVVNKKKYLPITCTAIDCRLNNDGRKKLFFK